MEYPPHSINGLYQAYRTAMQNGKLLQAKLILEKIKVAAEIVTNGFKI